MAIATVNPATGETLRTFTALDDDGIEAKLQRSEHAFRVNRARSFADRAQRLRRASDVLEQRKEEFGRLMTIEMGKPIGAAIAEAQKCALNCRYYADHGEAFLRDERVETD